MLLNRVIVPLTIHHTTIFHHNIMKRNNTTKSGSKPKRTTSGNTDTSKTKKKDDKKKQHTNKSTKSAPKSSLSPSRAAGQLFPEFKELLAQKEPNQELEARFRWYGMKKLDARVFHSTLRGMNAAIETQYSIDDVVLFTNNTFTEEITTVTNYNDPSDRNAEYTTYRMIETRDGEQTYQKKERKSSKDDKVYNVRFALSTEEDIKKKHIPKDYIPFVRRRTRLTYKAEGKGEGIQFDFTIVNEIGDGAKGTSYEIEMEVDTSENEVEYEICELYIVFMLKLIQESKILVTNEEQRLISTFFLSPSGFDPSRNQETDKSDKIKENKPEDLLLPFFEQFGIVQYNVTVKADGLRKMLLIGNDGSMYLIDPKSLAVTKMDEGDTAIQFQPRRSILVDGEFVMKRKRHKDEKNESNRIDVDRYTVTDFILEAKYFEFFIFDVLFVQNPKIGPDIRKRPFPVRYEQAQYIASNFEGEENSSPTRELHKEQLNIYVKSFIDIIDGDVFTAASAALDRTDLRYEQDGLIFTPINEPYIPMEYQGSALVARSRTKKWKPIEKLTIDFRVKVDGDGNYRLWYGVKKGVDPRTKKDIYRESIFEGGIIFPWDGKFTRKFTTYTPLGEPIKNKVKEGEIAEFAYINGKFVPVRIRTDKESPSIKAAADDTWFLINRPVTEDTLRGNTVQLMTLYHNEVKTRLLSMLRPYTYVCDVGSAQGGDISKWKRGNLLVTAIEPSPEMREELESRLESMNYTNNVVIINKFFDEDTVAELGKYPAITMFNSITFFDPETIFDLLNKVSKCNTRLFIIGFDWKLFEEQVESRSFEEGPLKYKRDKKNTSLRGGGGQGKIKIKIDNTIVDYEENTFDYHLFLEQAGKSQWTVEHSIILDQRIVLSNIERLYTRSTRLIVLSRSSPVIEYEIPEVNRATPVTMETELSDTAE